MFIAIYQFDIKPEKRDQFVQSWKELTQLIYEFEGSLGSRLHRESEIRYIAYAQWPNRDRWKHSGDQLPEEANTWRAQMKEACTEIKTLHALEMDEDLLKNEPFRG